MTWRDLDRLSQHAFHFRGIALNQKREETAAVDSIVAEDIGKFPDSNLAESMQRIPGVALSRGDGGEGRNIAVRGLGSQFTRAISATENLAIGNSPPPIIILACQSKSLPLPIKRAE